MKRLFSVYGDSISTFESMIPNGWNVFYTGKQLQITGVTSSDDTWWSQVISHFDGELLANASWSGSVVEGDEFPTGASDDRIGHLAPQGTSPDDILVHIGINDYGWGSAQAQIRAGVISAPKNAVAACESLGEIAGMAPENTVENFRESYTRMLKTMHSKWPDARIWASSLLSGRVKEQAKPTFPRHFRGISFEEYNDAIAQAAKATPNCYFVDMASFGFDYEAADGTHPTAKGMRQLAALFIKGMRNASPSIEDTPYEGEALLTEDMRSAEFCTNPCVGCEHAKSTGNAWFHVCEKQLNK